MPHADFVHLRVHSAYSLSQGAIRVPEIAALARAAQMPAVAITDTGNLFGALEFSQYCAGKGVQPIIGCQVSLAARGRPPGAGPATPRGWTTCSGCRRSASCAATRPIPASRSTPCSGTPAGWCC